MSWFTLHSAAPHKHQPPSTSHHPHLPPLQVWWHTTVLVAAITAFLQPYYIAFAPPGL